MILRFAVPAMVLIACMVTQGGLAADRSVLDSERRAQLNAGNAAQRSEVLVWLAEHGSQSDTESVVPRLKDMDARVRQLAELTLWSMWLHSGDEQVDTWMNEAQVLMSSGDFEGAISVFTQVVQRSPSFAEGYNKRATALYLNGDFDASLKDIAAVLKINPSHFGALSGAGLCLLKLERPQEALFYFECGLEVNPNMDGIRSMVESLRRASPRPSA
ncbi:MAG TPA: tetratricopeptide repeat protein [bacterium]